MGKNRRVGAYQLFMLGLSIYVLAALAAETFFRLPAEVSSILSYMDTGICIIFLLDFLFSLSTAPNRLRYFVTWGWIDLISSIPAIGYLRWGRAGRILRILRLFRDVRSTRHLADHLLQRRAEGGFLAAALISILVIVFSSIAIASFEAQADGNISRPEDALWWSFVTITTVGYGDFYPATSGGRIVAAVWMVAGVGLFGTFTGFVASWFVGTEEAAIMRLEGRVGGRLDEIQGTLQKLEN